MKKAVALRYDQDKEKSPRVIATGKGETAENIIKIAQLHNLPIQEDADLVELLSKVELDKEIPEKLVNVANGLKDFGNLGAHAEEGELTEKEINIIKTSESLR